MYSIGGYDTIKWKNVDFSGENRDKEIMSIFQIINNDRFFNPFCCRNKEIYLDCINRLIDKAKEIPVLYEPDAKQCLALYLQNCRYVIETEDIGEEISGQRSVQENASAILRYFRLCGWITAKEIGRNGENIASVSSVCRKLIEAMNRLFDSDMNGAITNHIFAIYEILKAALDKDSARAIRPYTNIMMPLLENESDLKNELFTLKDSIREIMHAVMQITDANSFGQFLIRDEILEKFFNDYFFIKRSGLIPGYIAGIDRMLTKIRRSDIFDRMIEEFQELKQVLPLEAQATVERQFGELDSFINAEYEKEMTYIDRKINTYYSLYSTRMMMVLSNNTNLQHFLNRILMQMKDMEADERERMIQALAENFRVQSVGFISRKSFERRRKANPNPANEAILESGLSEEEKRRLTEELLEQTPDYYSPENVKNYFDQMDFVAGKKSVEDMKIKKREDAMMVAVGVIYSGTQEFPYQVEFGEGMVETDIGFISRLTLTRKEKGGEKA